MKAGAPATFYCRVTGDPAPTIHWRKNGKKQPGGHTRIFIENFPGVSMLRINPARHVRDDAVYECMAENGVGDPVTASANLTVFSGKRCQQQTTILHFSLYIPSSSQSSF